MDRAALVSHSVAGVAIVGLGLSWLILLGGLSAVQKSCIGHCRTITGLPWFLLWFQGLLILLLAAVQFVAGLAHGRTAVLALLALSAALDIYLTDQYLDYKTNGEQPVSAKRYNTVAAAFALLSFFNLLSIILLAFQPSGGGGESSSKEDNNVYGSGTTTYSNPVAKSGGTPGGRGPGDSANLRPFHTARSTPGPATNAPTV